MQAVSKHFEHRIVAPGDEARHVQCAAQVRVSSAAHHRAAFNGAARYALAWRYADECGQRFGVGKAPHIAGISQHLGHCGFANAGNAVQQLCVALKIGAPVNVVIDVAFKLCNLRVLKVQVQISASPDAFAPPQPSGFARLPDRPPAGCFLADACP